MIIRKQLSGWPLAALALAALGGCDGGSEQPAPSAPPPKPSFDQTVPGVQATIAGLGSPWAKPARHEIKPDPVTGGTLIETSGDRGSAELHRLPDGWIQQVRLTSGAGETCGDPADVMRAIPLLLTGLATKVTLSDAQAKRLQAGLAAGKSDMIDVGAVRLAVQGGCIQQLSVTAIPMPPSQPKRL